METGENPRVQLNSLSTAKKCAVCGGFTLFVLVFCIIIIGKNVNVFNLFNPFSTGLFSFTTVDSVHTIEEGNVGIYFVQGALDDEYTHPGVHWSVPFVTTIEEITIRPQTETLESISTVTRDGIQNTFHNIQVHLAI